ncbi:hypothetical protein [Sandaracinus amylolyticus]|uniref:hypothetical protein n=1 Tax=Sandaracinus amylolyticus TaxID=927083 RepID=UPI001F1F6929|nr:hypothetical protein [Sandaracinus amylolyticus]UJR84589.1 Hypothetical protein I5071_66680 [Sandaracinus amylolyticus]
MRDSPAAPSSVGGLHVLAIITIVLGVLLSIPTAFVTWFRMTVEPTPTLAALAGWYVWVVPIAALVLDAITRGRALWRVLAIGWGSAFAWCLVALVLFGRYPSRGPHEAIAFSFFALTVGTSVALGACALRDRVSMRAGVAAAIFVIALSIFGGHQAMRIFTNELAWALPMTSYPVRQYHYSHFMGCDVRYASAPIDRATFDALVRERGLVPGVPERASDDSFAPSWFHIDEDDEIYFEPIEPRSEHAWCWSIAAWNGTDTMLTRGCVW